MTAVTDVEAICKGCQHSPMCIHKRELEEFLIENNVFTIHCTLRSKKTDFKDDTFKGATPGLMAQVEEARFKIIAQLNKHSDSLQLLELAKHFKLDQETINSPFGTPFRGALSSLIKERRIRVGTKIIQSNAKLRQGVPNIRTRDNPLVILWAQEATAEQLNAITLDRVIAEFKAGPRSYGQLMKNITGKIFPAQTKVYNKVASFVAKLKKQRLIEQVERGVYQWVKR